MTIKERDSEMLEIFKRKSALTEKIEFNIREVNKIDSEIARVNSLFRTAENIEDLHKYRLELKKTAKKGRNLLAAQVKERKKLSFNTISKQLNVKRSYLDKQYWRYMANPWAFEAPRL